MSDKIGGLDLGELDSAFGDTKPAYNITPSFSSKDIEDLDKHFGEAKTDRIYVSPYREEKTSNAKPAQDKSFAEEYPATYDVGKGILRGAKDVLDSGAHGLARLTSYAADKLLPESLAAPIRESKNETIAADKAARDQYDLQNPSSEGFLPTAEGAGRIAGQTIATLPVMPVRAMQAVSAGAKAIPYVGKLAGLVGGGALAGGTFGAATSSANDDSLANNVGTNALYGAAAGPVAEVGIKAAGKAISGIQNIARSIKTNNILKNSSIDANAARNTLARLTDAGYTPAQAHAELQRMGSEATISDLTPSLTAEAGSLASRGGVPTDTLKNRYGARADYANSVAHDIMEQRLGAKPDYEAEKVAAKLDRQQKTSSDYNAAKASNMALDVMPIARDIATKLENAVGSEAKELHEIGSYLFDSKGNIKTDTAPLLKVRQALDDRLSKLKKEGTSQATATYRAVSNVRDDLDKVLKTNPDLAIADAKYAKLRQDFEGLDLGKKAVSASGNYDNFAREFNLASPEKQEFMRKGLRIQIGDLMEKASRGELSEAQRLFGKSTSNRNIIKLAFGSDGDAVLNALEKEAKFRATEHKINSNSETGSRVIIANRPEYGGNTKPSIFGDALIGGAMDATTGSLGVGTAIMAGKRTGSNLLSHLSDAKIKRTIEGTADLLSRQSQHGRGNALDILERIRQVGNARKFKLPVDNSNGGATLLAIPSVKTAKQNLDEFRGVKK